MPTYPSSQTINYNNVNTFTESTLWPEVKDAWSDSNPLMQMLDAKKRRVSGGTYIRVPLEYAQGPFAFFDGRSPIDVSEQEQFTSALFQWKWCAAGASISANDEAMNSGEAASISLIKNKYSSMIKTFQDGIGQSIHSAGTNPLEIVGLQSAIAGSGTTYGQVSGTTYSWWRSVTRSMSGVPLSASEMDAFITDLTVGKEEPMFFVGNRTVRGIVYNTIEPYKRSINMDEKGSLGFRTIEIHNLPFYMDPHSAAQTLYAINTNHLELMVHSMWDAKFLPWDNWVSPFMKTCYMVSSLNLVCSNRRFQGKMTSLTQ